MNSANEIAKRLLRRRLLEAKEKINYSELDHDDLVRMAKNEDDKAFEELMKQYDPLISKIVRKYFLESGHGDEDDVRQIATIAFWNAVESYDPSAHKKGFGSYASMVMDRKLTDELRKDSAEKRQIYNVTNSTEDVLGDDGEGGQFTVGDTLADDDQLSPEEYYLGVDGAQDIMNFMMNNFSDKERDVVMRRIKGDSISDIMEETGMKYKAVENTLKRIKDKLAEYLRFRESRKIRESADLTFSEEEKKILTSVLNKVDEQKSIAEDKNSQQAYMVIDKTEGTEKYRADSLEQAESKVAELIEQGSDGDMITISPIMNESSIESLKVGTTFENAGFDWEILAIDGEYALVHAKAKKFHPYAVVWKIDPADGTWAQGHYFDTESAASRYLKSK